MTSEQKLDNLLKTVDGLKEELGDLRAEFEEKTIDHKPYNIAGGPTLPNEFELKVDEPHKEDRDRYRPRSVYSDSRAVYRGLYPEKVPDYHFGPLY